MAFAGTQQLGDKVLTRHESKYHMRPPTLVDLEAPTTSPRW